MRVSLNTIRQYIDFELPPVDELVAKINAQLGGVEEVIDLAPKYKDAKIVKVVECEKHPNADRLNVCKIDDGSGELIQVVCGAPNVHAGMFAVWLPPESIVPSTYGTNDEFKLGARELRGVMSNGMLAAGDELAINNDHDGIIEIDPNEWKPNDIEIKPGISFAAAYGLDDQIIDIENKMFTHRPDLFGQIGVAREIAGILGHTFKSPEWYMKIPEFANVSSLPLAVFNDAIEKVPRFMAVVLKDVEVKPSPLWLQIELVRLGSKAINNIVDVTNYVMLLTAQPTHAYDYDKLRGTKLGARMAKPGEKATLLNGKTYELDENDIVIADGEGVIGLGGIMGGLESEVSNETKNIVLEVANFDMYAVRKSSMRHGIFTDALTRFNKGQSPLQNDHVLNLLMMSVRDVAGGEQASDIHDVGEPTWPDTIRVTDKFINERLGLTLQNADIKTLLGNVEVQVDSPDDHDTYLEVFPPFWRTDLELPEDIVEEVGRLHGFGKLPRELPTRRIKPTAKNTQRELKQRIRERLAKAGANEVLTYSFVHERVLKNAQQNAEKAYRLSNALSPDLQYYRLSVLPSLLEKVHMNSKAGVDTFTLFEIGKAHHKDTLDDENLPREFERVAGVYANKKKPEGAPYFQVKRSIGQLVDYENIRFQPLSEFDFGDHDVLKQLAAPFEPKRSAFIWNGEKFGGVVGELKQSVQKAFKLPENTAAFELFLSFIEGAEKADLYRPLSKYPSLTQDISLKVANEVPYAALQSVVEESLTRSSTGMTAELSPVAVYQSKNDLSTKTITFRIKVTSFDRTLREEEVTSLVRTVAEAAKQALAAEYV